MTFTSPHDFQFSIYMSLTDTLAISGFGQWLINLFKNNFLVTYHLPYPMRGYMDEQGRLNSFPHKAYCLE